MKAQVSNCFTGKDLSNSVYIDTLTLQARYSANFGEHSWEMQNII